MKRALWYRNQRKQRVKMMVVTLFSIAENIIYLLTFGAIDAEFRPRLLFSDWLDEDSESWTKGFWSALCGK